jgi:deoxyribodipyrimidine photolyase-like uncharacterized protein
MTPSEYTFYKHIEKIKSKLNNHNITIEFRQNTQFLITQEDFSKQYTKPPIMETFYRWMRKEFNILIQDGKPQ